jgi:hypothetical protein
MVEGTGTPTDEVVSLSESDKTYSKRPTGNI